MSGLVNYALWGDIWKYIKLNDLREYFDRIQWRTHYLEGLWTHALEVWDNAN